MKIVMTDAQTVTNGDLDLNRFRALAGEGGSVDIYPLSTREESMARIADADCVLINKTVLDAEVLSHAPHLSYIGIFATGYNMVDLDYCKAHGITVCNAGSYSTDAVAQTVFAFLLHRYSRVWEYDAFVKEGGWISSPSFSPFVFATDELAGKTIGIVGFGAIGKKVGAIANAFGMKVLVLPHRPDQPMEAPYTAVDFDTLLSSSDVITCHCPLTQETKEMFDAATFAKCKKGAYFINTSRGGVVVEAALRDALNEGHLSGAGIDVLTEEPMREHCVLRDAKNITFTPHVAWAPLSTRQRLLNVVYGNLENYLAGAPTNVIV